METLPIHVFKDSFGPLIALLNEHRIKYMMREVRSDVPLASSGVIEIVQSAAMWGALAGVVVAFIKARNGRKVIITTKDNNIVHAEGLCPKELEKVLAHAKSLAAMETQKRDAEK